MARRGKLEKFAELLKYPHVFETVRPACGDVRQFADKVLSIRGRWRSYVFKNGGEICLELACGKGEYSVGLAKLHPDHNYIGVDIKGARIHKGATTALKEQLNNVAFLRTRIEHLEHYFEPGEINEIWIVFPDPFPAKENRRLTSPVFLDKYYDLLASGSKIHLKTDDDDLYDYSAETATDHPKFAIEFQSDNISDMRLPKPELNILTFYEQQHLQEKKTIKYLQLVKID